jgi:hypothetical protein
MSYAAFTQTLHSELRPLVQSMFCELRANPGTSHYHRLDDEELLRRGQDVYQNLTDWLASRDTALVQKAGMALGQKRFAEGIPLGQLVLALLLQEKNLWNNPITAGFSDGDLHKATCEFFQQFIYWAARGFAVELDSGKRPPGRVVPPPPEQMPRKHAAQQPADEPVTRGGQIGEHGG